MTSPTAPMSRSRLIPMQPAIRDKADRSVNTVVPTAAVLVLLDPIFPVPVTLTAVIMMLVVVVLVLRPPIPHGNETPPPDTQQPSR
jgi:hypothetical protein